MTSLLTRLSGKTGDEERVRRYLAGGSITAVSRVRVWPFVVVAMVAPLLLFGRLLQLTVVEGSFFRNQAENNRVVGVRVTATRGVFFDRNGTSLARNIPFYKRQVPGTTIHQAQFEPLTKEQALAYVGDETQRVFFDQKREYLCGRACAAVLGYVGEVSEEELKTVEGDYVVGDAIGKVGLEKALELPLRGRPGSQLVEVDAKGVLQRLVGNMPEQSGVDQQLTLDVGLQQLLYAELSGRDGAAVAQIPQTGEILALVSSPAFDPNNLAVSLTEPGQPFFNRAVSGTYPPGSVFKVATAIAGLEEGKISGSSQYEDTGEIVIDQYRYGNWYYDEYGKTEGSVDVVKALARSNDIFFYRVGEAMGPTLLAEWARALGYGRVIGSESLGAVPGLVPSPSWKEKYKGERWFLGDTYHMAIGQGDVLVTPLQVNQMMGAVAANGSLCPPYVVASQTKTSCQQLNLKPETLTLVQAGLRQACAAGGTAFPFFGFSPQVACKTGTAQFGGEKNLPHAWFTVYAPADNPEIVLTVMVDSAGQGSEVAAPIAKKALEYWFDHK